MLKPATPTRFASLAACTLAGALTLSAPRTAHAGNANAASSQVRYRQATDAYKQHKFEEARRILLGLWTEARTYDVAVTLVQAEYQLGHYAAAANYLVFALANVPPTEKLDSAAKMKKDLAQLRELAEQLQLTVSEPGAAITIDGASVGTSPLGEFYVDDGQHTVAARLGERTVSRAFRAEKGKVSTIELSLPAAEATVVEPPPPTAQPVAPPPRPGTSTPSTDSPNYTPPVIAAAVGGAAVVAGVVVLLVAHGKSSDREDLLRDLPGQNACAQVSPPSECGRISDLSDQARTFRTLGYTSLGLGLAAGVATYLLWPAAPERRPASGLTLWPTVSAHSSTFHVGAVGRF